MSTERISPAKRARRERVAKAKAAAAELHPQVEPADIVHSFFGTDLVIDVVGEARYRDTVDDIEGAYTGIEGAR